MRLGTCLFAHYWENANYKGKTMSRSFKRQINISKGIFRSIVKKVNVH